MLFETNNYIIYEEVMMDGLLLVNKPKNMTSRDVVNRVSKVFKLEKIGHSGTLDPMATGVLVLCIGKATKIASLIIDYQKEYIAEITLGIETDTLDSEGKIIKKKIVKGITKNQIIKVLNNFVGPIKQEVPLYSAVKVKGKRLYEYARRNIDVKLPFREVIIDDLKLIDDLVIDNHHLKFKIKCMVSKGTYIRSLARDIAYQLNTVGYLSSLVRIKQGQFKIDDCYSLKDINNNNFKLISLNEALNHFKRIEIDDNLVFKIKNGQIINRLSDDELVVIIDKHKCVLAIYQVYQKDKTKMKPYIML